jgi:peptidoglycan/xylan/chitin deacetylase (PgdA/CDA1 family)
MTKRLGLVVTALLLAAGIGIAPTQAQAPAVFVTLWFDTEDYVLPQSDDAAKRLAEILTKLGVRATFKMVGEKARVLQQRGRTDVIEALRAHEIGYHTDMHSRPPTPATYLQHAGWEDGIAEFLRREGAGAKDVERILGRPLMAYGQPGSSWAPQAYPALRAMGIPLYLDEADHVGLDDQPFYYGGMLNVFRMRSTLARMELKGGTSLAEGKAAFLAATDRVRAKGGGTVSVYYHPCEWVHARFWDAVNFSDGANPPREEWKKPDIRPSAETEQAFGDFERFIAFAKSQPGVRFVVASELARLYADRALAHDFTRDDLLAVARAVQGEQTFLRRGEYALSVADMFSLLTQAAGGFAATGAVPSVRLRALDGPAENCTPTGGGKRLAGADQDTLPWEAFSRATGEVVRFTDGAKRVPAEIWVGAQNISPSEYLATLGGALETLIATGRPPAQVTRLSGTFTADRHVAADTPDLWSWPIFPKGFHAPRIMQLARLQAWTLKPALLQMP